MISGSCRSLLILVPATLFGDTSAGGAEVHFKPRAEVVGAIVTLGDIAEIRGSASEIELLQQLELFPAPTGEGARFVRTVEVQQLLRLHGVEARTTRYGGAAVVRISGRAASQQPSRFGLTAMRPAQTEAVVCTVRGIAAGERVRAVDVELKVPEGGWHSAQPARSLAEVVGREATRPLAAGQAVDLRTLRKPLLVTRGQAVTVVARSAGVRATTTARALEDGAQGDLITLESLETKQRYAAVVTDVQQAEVMAASASVADPGLRPSAPPAQRAAAREWAQVSDARMPADASTGATGTNRQPVERGVVR
jgi:flagella basal body P-ring formation protein FlgA